ncbi:unnamed protein product [Oppiella nova]|uniref:Legumain n=1 Tax=Oppiella nova TaxID=334625 RepID=A0A7R9M4S4_9ACAR|nr:unnamed protein product [Oppiella nova]CAG2169591.1 unnamed protein product [Oppiella nova]
MTTIIVNPTFDVHSEAHTNSRHGDPDTPSKTTGAVQPESESSVITITERINIEAQGGPGGHGKMDTGAKEDREAEAMTDDITMVKCDRIIRKGDMNSMINAVPFGNNFDTGDSENIWVVLVAGSGGWFSYGAQSDVYKAYQLVHSQGIPDDHIIVMHPDDIAYDKQNPTPGVIINAINGTNVYKGVPKDYTGNDVTTKNLFGLLNGDSELVKQGKKVVKSNPKNRIFVYLMSHGDTG